MKSPKLLHKGVAFPLLIALTLWLGANSAEGFAAGGGTTYYVSSVGKDSASGLGPQSPWLTVARVNKASLRPGDQVLFQGGGTYAGSLSLDRSESGTAAAPITFGTYGTGAANIAAGTGAGFWAYDVAGVVLANLKFLGSGAAINTSDGVSFYNDLAGGIKLPFIRISNVDVSGFGGFGIAIGGYNGTSGFTDVQVTYATLLGNRKAGLISYGPSFISSTPSYANSNFYVGHVTASDNLGDARLTTNSGSGIVLGSVQGATVERSSAYGNGSSCTATECGAGIWAYDSTGITLQYNESYRNHSASSHDGDGFDLDQNVSASYMQYNYAHDNDGAGFLDYTGQANSSHSGNTIRYNVSENDARTNIGSVTVGGRVINDNIYDNTVFVSASVIRTPPAVSLSGMSVGLTIRNNVFVAKGIALRITAPGVGPSAAIFQQNDYFGSLTVVWGSSSYLTLDSWRAATHQESLGARNLGLTADPALTDPGGGGTIGNPDLLVNLGAYRLAAGSPMDDVGLDLLSLFGISPGTHDFYGGAVPTGRAADLGANESS